MELRAWVIGMVWAGLCLPIATATATATATAAAAADTPPHLAIARELVDHVQPEDNEYKLGSQRITLPGDAPGSRHAVRADCSGFLLALFQRAGYSTRGRMVFLDASPQRKRPRAEDFVASIEQQKGFVRIARIDQLRPGDLLAHAMLDAADKTEVGTTGHVFLVDSVATPITPRRPLVAGTRQFELRVIDSNNEFLGDDDTRMARPSHPHPGLGRGTIRLYADEQGQLVGWARTFRHATRSFSYDPRFPSDTRRRKAVMGRPEPK